MKRYNKIIGFFLLLAFLGCSNHSNKYNDDPQPQQSVEISDPIKTPGMSFDVNDETGGGDGGSVPSGVPAPASKTNLSLVKFYVENSGSIFGYVKGATEYVDALSDMTQHPDFVHKGIPVDISFVNGKEPIKITPIGSSFGNRLNVSGMTCGQTKYSDLNVMFDTVLANAKNNVITVLVSDGIYDIGNNDLNALTIKGRATRTAFLKRLNDSTSNLQTLLVKMSSDFDGKYFYATKNGSVQIHQQRPYYIWIIGDSELLNQYFSDSYLVKLKGYQNHARYVKVGNNKLPFAIDYPDCLGDCKPDYTDDHSLATHRAYHNDLEVALIVDYDGLHYPDTYLLDPANYACNFGFQIKTIAKASPTQTSSAGVSIYKRPFFVLLKTNQPNPRGKLTLKLMNTLPSWIASSNAINENAIDSNTTYGFSTLTQGIREAYEYVSDSIPAIFEVTFK